MQTFRTSYQTDHSKQIRPGSTYLYMTLARAWAVEGWARAQAALASALLALVGGNHNHMHCRMVRGTGRHHQWGE